MTTFFAKGSPAPKGSKSRGRGGHMYESSKALPAWMSAVKLAALAAHKGEPLDGPLKCVAVFIIPKPKRPTYDQPIGPADTDKLQRAVGDAMEQAGVIRNDSRIMIWQAMKRYPEGDEVPGAYVSVSVATVDDWIVPVHGVGVAPTVHML